MKLNEIQDLIKFVSKSGVSEVELETKEVKIVIKTTSKNAAQVIYQQAPVAPQAIPQQVVSVPQTQVAAASNDTKAPAVSEDSKYVTIKSPMIGTFYRSPGPDKPLFVDRKSVV